MSSRRPGLHPRAPGRAIGGQDIPFGVPGPGGHPDLAALGREADGAAGRGVRFAAGVTSAGQVQAAFARADAAVGTPRLAAACAGTAGVPGPLRLADPQQWWQPVAVHLRGTMLTAHCAIRRLPAAGRGRLVTVYGSRGGRQQGHASASAAAKAAITRPTEPLACKLARADAQPAAGPIPAIAPGAAGQLTATILHPDDDLAALTAQCRSQPGRRRLRLDLS